MLETEKFSTVGNNLYLDFVNTDKMRDGQRFDALENFADLVAWALAVNLLDETQARELLENWSERAETGDFFREAIGFRNLLREMTKAIVAGRRIENPAIEAINAQLKKQSGFAELERTEKGFEKQFRFDFSRPENLLRPVAEAAADFLSYGNFDLLKKCGNSQCVLYFYDTTKNHRRRWCSMTACGNKAKVSAFYRRQKSKVVKTKEKGKR
jgi:predicted RNA-binding Zn ribbon-like protein